MKIAHIIVQGERARCVDCCDSDFITNFFATKKDDMHNAEANS